MELVIPGVTRLYPKQHRLWNSKASDPKGREMKKHHQEEQLLHDRHHHSGTTLRSGNLIRLPSYHATDQGTQAKGPLSREALSSVSGLYMVRLGWPLA